MSGSVYAKPVMPRIMIVPAATTLAMHAALIVVLTMNWSGFEEPVIQVKPLPKVINAKLVDIESFRPKPKPKPKAATPKPRPAVSKTAPKPKPVATKPKPQAKPAPQPKPVEQPKPEPRLTEAELAALTRADLAAALDQEEEFVAEATAEELSASYAALIQQTVVNYWSRPPSARNGMEALLQIQLIPTGEVVSVSVLKSSGNGAFDRSAINAVEKAGSFPELKNLPPREFERTFRRFRLLFRPEDLRY